MKKFFSLLLAFIILTSMLALVSCDGANYKKYAGEYYSNLGLEGQYKNYPKLIVFYDDGTGYFLWNGTMAYFKYTVASDGTVDMKAPIGFLDYDGKFNGSSYILDDHSLTYQKR